MFGPDERRLCEQIGAVFLACLVMSPGHIGTGEEPDADLEDLARTYSMVVERIDRLVQEMPPESVLIARRSADALLEAGNRAEKAQESAQVRADDHRLGVEKDFEKEYPGFFTEKPREKEVAGESGPVGSMDPKIVDRVYDTAAAENFSDNAENFSENQVEGEIPAGGDESNLTETERDLLVASGARSFARSLVRSAEESELRPAFLLCVMRIESDFEPDAVSHAGAVGLMQLMPATASDLGVNPWDLSDNISGGAKLIDQLLDRYEEDVSLAMAAYNAGPGAVAEYGGIPPYRETQRYVGRIAAECPPPRP